VCETGTVTVDGVTDEGAKVTALASGLLICVDPTGLDCWEKVTPAGPAMVRVTEPLSAAAVFSCMVRVLAAWWRVNSVK
jgi:hypothetical protein